MPLFTWEAIPKENGYSNVRIIWQLNLNGNPGSHFFVKYKLKGETIPLKPNQNIYQIQLKFVDFKVAKLM